MKKKLLCLFIIISAFSYAQEIDIELFAQNITNPVEIAHAGDSRLFVAEQTGRIKIVNTDGTVNSTPFLTVSTLISSGGERGLLGLAFHPDYATNGYFYINYTNTSGDTVIARYSVSSNPDVANSGSATILLTVDQPYSNHNGGCIRFGPDGYLYISMGDGGSGGDPQNNAQNINSLLGKMLRLDVDNGSPYSSPATNPYVGTNGADEIWAIGLRNAWKFSFNRLNGDLWIADVGQNAVEEINRVVSPLTAGLNFGWKCYEGNSVYSTGGCGPASSYTMPFAVYSHSATGGCSITGGYVYTGSIYPNLQGKYLFADYCNDKIGVIDSNGTIVYSDEFSGQGFTVFGEDINGELYIGGNSSDNIYRIKDNSMSRASFTKSAFTIYPNPASQIVNINPKNGISAVKAEIYDLSGKLLIEKKQGKLTTINTDGLPAGMYMLFITDTKNNSHTHKLAIK
jgi:glucose/arabinose dehydrogenase